MRIEDIPSDYIHCYATTEQCPQCEQCLRHIAAQMNEQQRTTPKDVLRCVTPAYVSLVAKGNACEHFRSDDEVRFAKGMKHIFDLVPKSKFAAIRQRVVACFPSQRIFHQAQAGLVLISPITQARIIRQFENEELLVPKFDEYIYYPDWFS